MATDNTDSVAADADPAASTNVEDSPRQHANPAAQVVGPEVMATFSLPKDKPKPVAIVAVHGMGMQLRFETLNAVANAVGRAEKRRSGKPEPPHVSVKSVKVDTGPNTGSGPSTTLERAQLEINDGKAEVHIFECYWAPVTEGKVGLKDVVSFLMDTGNRAMLPSLFTTFSRWMFGGMKELPIKRGTPVNLVVTMLVVVSLLALNTAITWASMKVSLGSIDPAAAVYSQSSTAEGASGGQISNSTDTKAEALKLRNLTYSVSLVFAFALIAAGSLGLASRWRGRRVRLGYSGRLWTPLALLIKASCWLLFLAIIVAGFAVMLETLGWTRSLWSYVLGDETVWTPFSMSWSSFCWLVFALAIFVSGKVRSYLIQYAGDLAAYLTGHLVSKFHEVRAEVQKKAHETARAVYALKDQDGNSVYDRVIFVGHSLGSVVAYDTLNRLINEDQLAAQPETQALGITSRTFAFVTFGSPLDKTAFLFRNQAKVEDETREALAALRQPMIVKYGHRPKRWINIHSSYDIVSGRLEYYDDPNVNEGCPQRVKNIPDPEANIYLAAHSHFWENDLLGDTIVREALRPEPD